MRQPTVHAAVALLALGLVALSAACGKSSPSSPSAPLPSLESMLADKVLGDGAAPITILDYSSLTCSHCASFHTTTLPQIKSAYIDTGKAKLISRDFPLDDDGPAFSAAMVARCSGDRFFDVLDWLYKNQATWAGSSDPVRALKSAVAPFGLTSEQVDACLANAELRSGISAMRQRGSKDYGVTSTPTFIINGQTLVGSQPYSVFDALLKSLLP
jgi:protein-disulfide isomerase